MKKMCENVGMLVYIFGIIGSVCIAYKFGIVNVEYFYSGRVIEQRSWLLTVLYFLSGFIGTVIAGTLFYALADMLEKLNQIESALKSDPNINQTFTLKTGEWRCSNCGRINADYVNTCACGKDRYIKMTQ